ncbi:hypothetical protein niasHT_039338 [Heterodera trifolii]|uniref:non-specific serine/threonine protein kinase n=1 Tax=Heterodera trifolii TaxID=157864 RepID=A0ABD2INI0_9BILA
MSVRRINKILFRFLKELILPPRIQALTKIYPAQKVTSYLPKAVKPGKSPMRKILTGSFRALRNRNQLLRPFVSLHSYHIRLKELERARGFLSVRVTEKRDVLERVKHLFGTNVRYNRSLAVTELPDHLDGYEIGAFIAKGCNGAVHALKLRVADGHSRRIASQPMTSKKEFPLALKIMFNYNWEEVPERVLWKQMGTELIPLVPLPKAVLRGARMAKVKTLSRPHPNIIKMYTAFVDRMPILPEAEKLYPEALPNAAENPLTYELKTLHLVMKRYRMTLHDYLEEKNDYEKRDPMVGRLLFGQLLEAVVFLHKNKICHRDMKSDNILLDFDSEAEVPHLVLSDFGTAFATGKWALLYNDQMMDLEIRRASPGPNTLLNLEMADTWAAGTLAYEIFTGQNPFYGILSGETYNQTDLPILPLRIIEPIHRIVDEMLSVDPKKRPKPAVAANVVAVSLLRFGHSIQTFLRECGIELATSTFDGIYSLLNRSFSPKMKDRLNERLRQLTELFATETISLQLAKPSDVSAAELQLRATFLSRLDIDEMHSALKYFIGLDNCNAFGVNTN